MGPGLTNLTPIRERNMDEEKKAWESELAPAKRNATVMQRYREQWLGYGELLATDTDLDSHSKAVGAALGAVWDGKASITPELVEDVRKLTSLLRWSIKWAEEVAEMPAKEVKTYLNERIKAITFNDYENLAGTSNTTPKMFGRYVFEISASHLEILLLLVKYDLTEEFKQWVAKYAAETYTANEPPPVGYTYEPPEKINYPNDKISKNMRTATPEEWAYGGLTVIEQEADRKKKLPEITSEVKFGLDELKKLGYGNLDIFDFYVLYMCLAIQSAGNKATTINAIYRAMTGKRGAVYPPNELRKDIITSIVKCMAMLVAVDASGICEWYKYRGKSKYTLTTLLPAKIESSGHLNGVEVENLITFYDNSPLVGVAKAKGNQFITYDAALLDMPFRASRQNILIAPCLIQHIEDTRSGKITKTIIIDKLIDEIQFKGERSRFVKYMTDCFSHWKGAGYIKSYSLEKDGRGKAIKVKFALPSKKKQIEA